MLPPLETAELRAARSAAAEDTCVNPGLSGGNGGGGVEGGGIREGPADLVDTLESSISESPDSEDYSALSDLELEQRLDFAQYRHLAACAAEPCTPEEIRHVAAELEASSALCHQLSTLLAQRRGDP